MDRVKVLRLPCHCLSPLLPKTMPARYSEPMTSRMLTTTTTGAPLGITMMTMMITKRTPAGRWGDV
jgi:hypothetical protein